MGQILSLEPRAGRLGYTGWPKSPRDLPVSATILPAARQGLHRLSDSPQSLFLLCFFKAVVLEGGVQLVFGGCGQVESGEGRLGAPLGLLLVLT